jgi:hypothetical protein
VRLIQLSGPAGERRVCLVDEPRLRMIRQHGSIHALARAALTAARSLTDFVEPLLSDEWLDYADVYSGRSSWTVLPAADHPDEPARCLVSGTGLTHRRSADQRQAMHAADTAPTDSIRMYLLGEAGGRPAAGEIGVAPEWFYKGTGTILRAHNQTLTIPSFAEDGGEEPEIAGVYIIDDGGAPRRIGMTAGNEFSDHVLEKRNYLYLAHSKLRTCAIGPELVVDADFDNVKGVVSIQRGGPTLWSHDVHTGEANMCHSLANLEHHHFKYQQHRRPGDVHIHFFGADAFSFSAGIALQDGDIMEIGFEGFGRPLRNPVRREESAALLQVHPV